MALQIKDPLEEQKVVQIIDPLEKKPVQEQTITPSAETELQKQFGTLSNADIIAGKKKSDVPSIQIKDPLEEKGLLEKALPITSAQLKSVWEEKLGISDENKEKLKFILGDKNTLLGSFNNYLVDTGSVIIDTALRAGNSLGFIASGVAGDGLNFIYKTIDKQPGGAGERLSRDINGLLIGVMAESGTSFKPVPKKPNTIKSVKTGEEITNVLEYARKDATKKTEVFSEIQDIVNKEVDQVKRNDVIIGESFSSKDQVKQTNTLNEIITKKEIAKQEPITIDTPESLRRSPALPIDTVKKVTDAAVKFFEQEGIKVNREKPISLQIQEVLLSDKYDVPTVIRRIAEDNKIPLQDFNSLIFPSVSKSAKELNLYSQASKYLRNKLDPTGEIYGQFGSPVLNTLKRLDNVRRGLLVTRLATSVRNYITQSSRIGLDSLQNTVDFFLQKAIQPFVDPIQFQKNRVSPITSLQQLITNFRQWKPSEFKRIKKETDTIINQFPNEKNRIFLRYSSDILAAQKAAGKDGKVSRAISGLESATDTLNVVNKTQEFITRRAVFLARLDELVRANPSQYKYKTLEQLIKDGEHSIIRASDIANAVDKALEVTFAKEFNLGKGGYDAIAGKVIETINKLPFIATAVIPFPRFLMNSLKFHFEFSPLGITRFLSKAERQRLAKGDTSGLSRSALGLGLITAAIALRNQPYAGEKWYEFKIGDRTIDTRPFNPFAAYLFVADVYNRLQNGTLRNIDLKDVITVFAGIRGTTGLYLVDQMIDYFSNTDIKSGNPQWVEGTKKFLGELFAGYLTPLQNVTDAVAQFYPEMAKVRETTGQPFTGAFGKRVLSQDLPVATSATNFILDESGKPRAAPRTKEDPLVTQLTGIGFIAPKNSAEKEFDRLQILPREIFISTKIPELDRAYKDILSFKIGYGISKLVETDSYKSLPFNTQILVVKNALEQVKKESKQELQKDSSLVPFLLQYKLNQFSKDERRIINDTIGMDYLETIINNLKKEQ